MNWIHILIFVLAELAQWSHAQTLQAKFHMEGVTGQADVTWTAQTLTVTLNIAKSLGSTAVEIHPIWVNFDDMNKCESSLLGNTIEGLSVNATIEAGNSVKVTYSNVPSLTYVEGHSLVLRRSGAQKVICATIQQNVDHVTALVRLRGTILGHVYLRQAMGSGSSTRIVSDLVTQRDTQMATWRVTNSFRTCKDFMTSLLANIYDPTSSAAGGCSTSNQKNCAIGDLTSKLGRISFSSNVGHSVRQAYTDSNLPLFGNNNVGNLLMVIIPTDQSIKPTCGKINVYAERSAKAIFSNEGVTGTIEFSQKSPLDPTKTSVNLQGLNGNAGGYHVHLWPVPERAKSSQNNMCAPEYVSGHFNPFIDQVGIPGSANYPAAGASTYDMYEVGDLSAKYGMLNNDSNKTGTYTDYNLQLFGKNSIIGRSLVIHRNDATASRWVCVNIEPQYPVIAAEALFLYPVIGRVVFMQERDHPDLGTSVFASLDYIDERGDTQKHVWMVGSMAPGADMLEVNETKRCVSAGRVYNPDSLWSGWLGDRYSLECANNKAVACKIGDLSGKLGGLSIGNSAAGQDGVSKWFATDSYLPLSSLHSIIGKSIVIRNKANSKSLACATIKPVHPVALVARFTSGPVTGKVRFDQKVGFGSKQTTFQSDLTGLTHGQRQSLQIHELPAGEGQSACSDLGLVFDPLKVGNSPPSHNTDDSFKIGDLSRFAAKNTSYNLPLSGLNSIKGRSVAVMGQSSVVSCATIDWDVDGWTRVDAKVTYTGEVIGTITMHQHIHPDGMMSDTSILTDLKYTNTSKHSVNHNWHTHEKLVSGDSQAASGRCMSTGPHYNPFHAAVNEAAYASKCSKINQLRCELGDQSMKTMTINIGNGRKLHTDIFQPLFGKFSVQGRSIVVHVENKGAARFVCADIVPQTTSPVEITFKTPTTFSGLSEADKTRQIGKVYADAIRSYPGEVVVVIKSSNTQETTVSVHFLGSRSTIIRDRFLEYTNDEKRRDKLGPFSPTINFAGPTGFNIFLILFTLMPSIICSMMFVS